MTESGLTPAGLGLGDAPPDGIQALTEEVKRTRHRRDHCSPRCQDRHYGPGAGEGERGFPGRRAWRRPTRPGVPRGRGRRPGSPAPSLAAPGGNGCGRSFPVAVHRLRQVGPPDRPGYLYRPCRMGRPGQRSALEQADLQPYTPFGALLAGTGVRVDEIQVTHGHAGPLEAEDIQHAGLPFMVNALANSGAPVCATPPARAWLPAGSQAGPGAGSPPDAEVASGPAPRSSLSCFN